MEERNVAAARKRETTAKSITHTHSNPLSQILERLEKVRHKGGGQYSACCPAHDDKSPSLSVRETDEKVLLHCFGGCSPSEVLAALGLSLSDLYVKPLGDHGPLPKQRRWDTRALLLMLAHEALALQVFAHDLARGKPLDRETKARLDEAAWRVRRAAELVE